MAQLHNTMEIIAREAVDDYLRAHPDICGCESCRLDILALMLNKLPPQYAVSDVGAVYAKLRHFDYQNRVDLMVALSEAVSLVTSKPRHGGA